MHRTEICCRNYKIAGLDVTRRWCSLNACKTVFVGKRKEISTITYWVWHIAVYCASYACIIKPCQPLDWANSTYIVCRISINCSLYLVCWLLWLHICKCLLIRVRVCMYVGVCPCRIIALRVCVCTCTVVSVAFLLYNMITKKTVIVACYAPAPIGRRH